MSPSRRALVSLDPTPIKRPSPAAWPSVSLTSLKLSRSKNSTAIGERSLRDRASICSMRSTINALLGRPVSVSWRARWLSSRVQLAYQAHRPRSSRAEQIDERGKQPADQHPTEEQRPSVAISGDPVPRVGSEDLNRPGIVQVGRERFRPCRCRARLEGRGRVTDAEVEGDCGPRLFFQRLPEDEVRGDDQTDHADGGVGELEGLAVPLPPGRRG